MGGSQTWVNVGAVVAALAGLSAIVTVNLPEKDDRQIVNVSYDPTRELYQAINPLFDAAYARETRRHLRVVQSHVRIFASGAQGGQWRSSRPTS